MKIFVSLAIALVIGLSSVAAFAQPHVSFKDIKPERDTSMFLIFDDVTIGPFFTAGISKMQQNIEPGWLSDTKPAYTFGGTLNLDVNKWIGLQLGLAYDARELSLRTATDSLSMDMGIGYLDLQPSIRLFWLLIGLSIDIPMSANADEVVNHDNHLRTGALYNENRSPDVADIASRSELRAAVSIPVYHSDSGVLDLMVSGSMPVGATILGVKSYDSVGYFGSIGKGPLPTVQAGVSYQFDLLH